MAEPADTVAAIAVLVSVKLGHCTTIEADATTLLVLLPLAVAVFASVPQLAPLVLLLTCTEPDTPGAMLPNVHVSDWLPTKPETEQLPGPEYAVSMLQLTPDFAGSGSDRDADVTATVPVLFTVIV